MNNKHNYHIFVSDTLMNNTLVKVCTERHNHITIVILGATNHKCMVKELTYTNVALVILLSLKVEQQTYMIPGELCNNVWHITY